MNRRLYGALFRRVSAAVFSMLALAACETPPPRPLYLPIAEAESYGFSERRITDDKFEVTYLGPRRRVPTGSLARQADIEALSSQAEEIAELRTAELALASGYSAYRITNRRTDAEVTIERHDFYYPYYPGAYYFPHYRPYHHPFLFGPGYASQAYAQVRTMLTVAMNKTGGDDAKNAEATRDRLRRKYGGKQEEPATGAAY